MLIVLLWRLAPQESSEARVAYRRREEAQQKEKVALRGDAEGCEKQRADNKAQRGYVHHLTICEAHPHTTAKTKDVTKAQAEANLKAAKALLSHTRCPIARGSGGTEHVLVGQK